MATHVVHMVARLPSVTGFAEDIAESTLNVGFNVAPTGGDIQECAGAFVLFFTSVVAPQTDTIGEFYSATVSRVANACSILAYVTDQLNGLTPLGSPVLTESFTMPAVGVGSEMPSEVSTVLSYNADLTNVPVSQANPTPPPDTIRPQQRRRGRMFLGPIKASVGSGDAQGIFRVSPAWRQLVTFMLADTAATIASLTAGDLGVWSKADADVFPVVAATMDNAWDTQRRRGLAPTNKTILPF